MFEFISEEEMDELKFENSDNTFVYQLLQRVEFLQNEILDLKRELIKTKRKSLF